MKVSVIVPIYNVENYLERCLNSILAQSYTDYEIVCVDDCGSDSSMEIARHYAEQYPETIRIVASDRNVGLGGARDRGIAAAGGAYLAFVDSDDTITEDYLESYMKAAEETGADLVAGGYTRISGGDRQRFPGRPDDPWYCWVNVSAWAKVFRTSFLKEHTIDFRSVRTYEDAPFVYRCLVCDPKIAVIEQSGYCYYQNPGSITTDRNRNRMPLHHAFASVIEQLWEDVAAAEKWQEIYTYCLASQLITNLLFNGQHAGWKEVAPAFCRYDRFIRTLRLDLSGNPFISRTIPVSEPSLNRKCTWLVLKLRKCRMDKLLFMAVSVLPKIR